MSATTPVNETPSSQNQSAASESSSGGVNTSAVDLQHPMKLTSSEGEEFIIPYKAIRKSVLVRNVIEDLGIEGDDPVPLPNVDSATMRKVLDWCEFHADEPDSTEDEYEDDFERIRRVDICEWDREFLKVDYDMLFDIILAANYLDIKLLLDVGCKTVANLLRGKTTQEIRDMFQIENDFTPEEEEVIRRENAWAEATTV